MAAGGKIPAVAAGPGMMTVWQRFDHCLKWHDNGTTEAGSLKSAKAHPNQMAGSLGERFCIQSLTASHLQECIERRRRKGEEPVTLKKEVAKLRAWWNKSTQGELVRCVLPGRDLRFPKEEGTEPFRTFAEIEAIIEAEKPNEDREDGLWNALHPTRSCRNFMI